MDMDDINGLKPDWTNRRKLIFGVSYLLAAMLVVALVASIVLAYFVKFGLYISIFLTVFVTLCFIVVLGIIGSYVFGARWEHKEFLDILPGIIPDFQPNSTNERQDDDTIDTSFES